MAWRFRASKYKNAAPIAPRKEECISDIKVGSPQSCGNHVKASAAFIAFNVENRGGGSLGLVGVGYRGRLDPSTPLVHAHSDLITDFCFSPFDDGLLATCSTDANVHLWHIPAAGLTESLTTPEYSLPQFEKRVENVTFHPTADFLLGVSCFDSVRLWDVQHQGEVYGFSGHEDQVQSTAWQWTGSLLATTSRDRTIRVIDPRTDKVACEAESHKSPKDSRVVWVGGVASNASDRILSTGWDGSRIREVRLRDLRAFSKPYKVQSFDSSTGILMPLYDPDTNMLFLVGKADVSIMYWEVTDKEPFLTEGLKHNGVVQTKGACLVPKRGLEVMSGEVNRVLQLTANSILPITYQVPRKTYREFHGDLFPDTPGPDSACSVSQWLDGSDSRVKLISLDPGRRSTPTLQVHHGPLSKRQQEQQVSTPPSPAPAPAPVPAPRSRVTNGTEPRPTPAKPTVAVKETEVEAEVELEGGPKLASLRRQFENASPPVEEKAGEGGRGGKEEDEEEKENAGERPPTTTTTSTAERCRRAFEQRMEERPAAPHSPGPPTRRPTLSRSFRRICKFRHLQGTPGHKSTCIENLRDLSRTIPSECDGLAANSSWVVIPLSGAGGKLTVLPHQNPRRLPDGVVPSLVNTANVMDFAFDPFCPNSLAVACDDGKINFWHIPDSGLSQPTNKPAETLMDVGSSDKVTLLKFHPLASSILAVATGSHYVKVWDLARQCVALTLAAHPDQIFSVAWSSCGRYLATLCRDGQVRIFDPRHCLEPIQQGPGPAGVRGGRVLWGPGDRFIITVGFSKVSERQISVYQSTNLAKPLNTVATDISPAMLIPFYDPDTCTLFATGKGDSTIYAYEVGSDFPHLFPLSHHKCSTVHQGLVMLPKVLCDVKSVEFCKMLRLTSSTLEPLSFTVPRVKTEYFQDDLFPDTRITWEPVMTSAEWLGDTNRGPRMLCLVPSGMVTLSESREQTSPGTQPGSGGTPTPPTHVRHDTPPFLKGMVPNEVRQTQHKLEESLSQQMTEVVTSLEQDRMEGVDLAEWED